jgi:CrcB protein
VSNTALLVFVGGAVGAPTRYLTDRFISARHTRRFPFGTMTVNLVGCFVLGVLAGGVAGARWGTGTVAFLGTGFCGGLTTYSAFAVETVELALHRLPVRALGYACLSTALGIGFAELGWLLAR